MIDRLAEMTRARKRLTIFGLELALVPLALWMALALKSGEVRVGAEMWQARALVLGLLAAAALVTIGLGTHRIKIGSFDTSDLRPLGLAALALTMVGVGLNHLLRLGVPASVPLLFGASLLFLAVLGRVAGRSLLGRSRAHQQARSAVAVFGAGTSGMQIAAALRVSSDFRPVAIIDDNPGLHGLIIAGLEVRSPRDLETLIRRGRVNEVFLALPSAAKSRENQIKRAVLAWGGRCRQLPSFKDLIIQNGRIDAPRCVSTSQYLMREDIPLDGPEVAGTYAGRSVLVTGAGGSIGSELCRRLIESRPGRIVLYEQSELALYAIERELQGTAASSGIELVAALGSVADPARVAEVLARTRCEIILHAAAYKHVPMLETNELEAVRNNVFGTMILADAARTARVSRFILVSTDKAVRPSNVMGATKRLAEMIVQDMQRRSPTTIFSMVRFGNVLGSSGSVIPLFEEQIRAGGPVTVTHPEVTRFFMTIPEAARLVLLAGAMAEGSDVFVLDMGDPVLILDLARRMIELSGFSLRDGQNPDGDIAIEFVGLRPGEKLYEELLIDSDSLVLTPHPKILRALETAPTELSIRAVLRDLQIAIACRSAERARAALASLIEGFGAAKPKVAADFRARLALRQSAVNGP